MTTERKPMKFEIINPSDPYTMEADSHKVAAVAICVLGNGKYPLEGIDGTKERVPAFLFGGHDEWFAETFGAGYEATATSVLENEADALARAFDSVTLTSKRRTSMNDIGGRARDLASAVRANAGKS